MEIKFNTGRKYTAQGQVIRAIQVDDGTILFADDSRGIDGRLAKPRFDDVNTFEGLRNYVMFRYDAGEFTRDTISWSYLMQR